MMATEVAPKDPDDIDWFFFIWCDKTGTNANSATNTGKLKGATISSYTLTAGTGITIITDNKDAVTIDGVSYAASTVVSMKLSVGMDNVNYEVLCRIITSDGRTLDKTMTIPVRTA